MHQIQAEIEKLTALPKGKLVSAALELQSQYNLVQKVAATGKLPVALFAAGGISTSTDAATMMQLGADGVFVDGQIFKFQIPANGRRHLSMRLLSKISPP